MIPPFHKWRELALKRHMSFAEKYSLRIGEFMKMTIVCRTSAELDQIKRYAESLGASVEKSLSAAPNEATGQFSLPTGAGAEHGAVILPFPGLAKDKIMTMDELEKQAITAAISSSGGNMTSAAKSLSQD
jgi:hypothetical protein